MNHMSVDIELSSGKHAHELIYDDSIDIREKDCVVFLLIHNGNESI